MRTPLNTRPSKFKMNLIAFILLGTLSSPTYAISEDAKAIIAAINLSTATVVTMITDVFTYFKTQMDKNLEAEQPFFDTVSADNNQIPQLVQNAQTATNNNSKQAITDVIGPNAKGKKIINEMFSIKAGDSFLPGQGGFQAAQAQAQTQQELQCGNANFSFDSLLTPAIYETKIIPQCGRQAVDQKTYAINFIRNVANMGELISDFTPTKALKDKLVDNQDQAERLASSDAYKSFALSRRNLLSNRSVALSNLYYLYNQRIGVMIQGKVIQPSQMYQFDKLANSRIGNADWYAEMLQAYPAKLAREQVFILAEMQQELHQMRVENQRLLAAMSSLTLVGSGTSAQLLQLKLRAIQEEISNIKEAARQQGR